MSLLPISSAASTTASSVNFHVHGHKKGSHVGGASDSNSTTGQNPPAPESLFSNLLQSVQQVIGLQMTTAAAATATSATSAVTGAASTTANVAGATAATSPTSAAVTQDLNSFLHSLFQVLKQDGLGSGTGNGTTPAASTATTATATGTSGANAGQYQGSLVSSLQSLMQQLGANGGTNPQTAHLDATFNNLVQGLNGSSASTAAVGSAASAAAGGVNATAQSSSAGLQNFLNNLLQSLQSNGLQAPQLAGSNVNANV